jgi:pimeloyl-ACP methyl ester carboxylesterase
MSPRFHTLSSGRRLAYDLYGDPAGVPAFFFHGWPSSRVHGSLMDAIGKEWGVCLVAMDRPGIALSDHQPGRRLLDWPPVLTELAQHLVWDKFHLFGVSGGGPYVLATAHALPERILSANVICGAPPLKALGTRDLFWTYRLVLTLRNTMPCLLGPAFRMGIALSYSNFERPPMSWLMAGLSARDREVLNDAFVRQVIIEGTRDCLASGVPQVQTDGDIYTSDWGFDLKDIHVPVHVWHGKQDRNIPWTYAQKVAAALPQAIPHWTEDDGHYSLPVRQVRAITQAALQH